MIRHKIPIFMIFSIFLFLTCSEYNFLPVEFEKVEQVGNWVTIDKGGITKKWKTDYINPNETHRYVVRIDSGFTYKLFFSAECVLDVYAFVFKDGTSDTIQLKRIYVDLSSSETTLFSTFGNFGLFLRVRSESIYSNQKYSIKLVKSNQGSVSGNTYLDSSIINIKNKPIKSVVMDSVFEDSIVFDHINRKYLYAIPLDSFHMMTFSLDMEHWYYPRLFYKCALISGKNDSVLISDSSDDSWSRWNFWTNEADTLYLSVGADADTSHPYSKLYKIFGLFYDDLPELSLSLTKKKFPPVQKDAFYNDTANMIFLTRDTLYQLSLYDELSDKFYYTVNPDSVFSLSITSIDSLPISIKLSPMSSGFTYLKIPGNEELIFKPLISNNTLCIEISSSIEYPSNYSLMLGKYTGVDSADIFEPDNDAKSASLLLTDSTYGHTLFPDNDIDIYKMHCLGNDTFKININFPDSTVLKEHTNFSFTSFYNFTQSEMKIHELSKVDSAGVRVYTFFREVADTAVFIAQDRESLNYSVSLER